MDQLIKCGKCGWVHMKLTRAQAEQEVAEFNEFYNALPLDKKAKYSGMQTIASYEHCVNCGHSHQYATIAQDSDCQDGCTINPLISPDEPR